MKFLYDSGIYRLIFPNGKCYIGQSRTLSKRMTAHRNTKSIKQPKLHNAVKKYGKNNIKIEILLYAKDEYNLDEIEKYYIKKFDSIKNGYNVSTGGKDSLSGVNICSPMKGRKRSAESNKKVSESLKGRIVWNKGKKFSDAAKKNMRLAHLGKINRKRSTDGAIGTCFLKDKNKWLSSIRIRGKSYHLGYFDTQEEAAIKYQNKLKEIMKEDYNE